MNLLSLHSLHIGWVIVIFVASAGLVWWAGFRVSVYVNAISEITGVSKAFMGALLLGAITSLPEVGTTATATLEGNVDMAVNNLLGGVALQVAILAVADYFVKIQGVTAALTKSIVLLQGLLLIVILCVTIVGALVPDWAIFGVGFWVWIIFITGVLFFFLIHRYQHAKIFLAVEMPEKKKMVEQLQQARPEGGYGNVSSSANKLYASTAVLALLVLAGGYFCARSADIIAEKTQIGSSFMGIFFLAIATSLPELSTSISAMKMKQYELAFSDIFGTNIFDIVLIIMIDIFYTEGLIMNQIKSFSLIGAVVGIVITTIYLVGMVIKPRKQIFNLGIDSVAVIFVYLIGLFLLYTLK